MSEVTGSVLVEFNTSGEHKFTFKGQIDPLYIWTLGVQMKQAFDTEYILKARALEVKNQKQKQLDKAARDKREAKEKAEAEKVATEATAKKIKAEEEAGKKKKSQVVLLNQKAELERQLKKATEEKAPDITELTHALAEVNKVLIPEKKEEKKPSSEGVAEKK